MSTEARKTCPSSVNTAAVPAFSYWQRGFDDAVACIEPNTRGLLLDEMRGYLNGFACGERSFQAAKLLQTAQNTPPKP